MNRRTRNAEVAILVARLVAKGHASNQSAHSIAATIDKIQRASVRVARLHRAELDGDHERCELCGGTGGAEMRTGVVECSRCDNSGHKSEDEVKAWKLARDKKERGLEKLVRALGFLPPSDTTGMPDMPTWEIDRDVRGGTLRLYESQRERKRGVAMVVFPVKGL